MTMRTIGIYEAKNKLSKILEQVEAGEVIALSRHGKQVALLTPVHPVTPHVGSVIARLRKLRSGSRLAGLKIKDLRDAGRP